MDGVGSANSSESVGGVKVSREGGGEEDGEGGEGGEGWFGWRCGEKLAARRRRGLAAWHTGYSRIQAMTSALPRASRSHRDHSNAVTPHARALGGGVVPPPWFSLGRPPERSTERALGLALRIAGRRPATAAAAVHYYLAAPPCLTSCNIANHVAPLSKQHDSRLPCHIVLTIWHSTSQRILPASRPAGARPRLDRLHVSSLALHATDAASS